MAINIQQALQAPLDPLTTLPLIGLGYIAALAIIVLFVIGASRANS